MTVITLSAQRASYIAMLWYLNELQKKNLVTPSIARPYPKDTDDEEKWILHKAYRQVQQTRLIALRDKLSALKKLNVPLCFCTLNRKKLKFKKKLSHLVRKFNPLPVNVVMKSEENKESRVKRNKKSRERYKARKYKTKLLSYINNPESRGVVNLSSVNNLLEELMALELGYGFVLSPYNPMKEEALILEGFRFVDRLGKADADLAEKKKRSCDAFEVDEEESSNLVVEFGNLVLKDALPQTRFSRNAAVPEKLRFSLPIEPQLVCNESKCIESEFEDLNNKLINSVKSNSLKRKFNLVKRTRDALRRLKTLVREKVVDIRKVDKGHLILIIDYSQRKLIEENNISKIAMLCDDQKSNWEDNRDYIENKLKLLLRLNFIT